MYIWSYANTENIFYCLTVIIKFQISSSFAISAISVYKETGDRLAKTQAKKRHHDPPLEDLIGCGYQNMFIKGEGTKRNELAAWHVVWLGE